MAQNKQRPPGATPAPKTVELPEDYAGQPQEYLDVVIGKRGEPLAPLYETVVKAIEELMQDPKSQGRFPTTNQVCAKAKGDPKVCLAHYHRIKRERFGETVEEITNLKKQAKEKDEELRKLRAEIRRLEGSCQTMPASGKTITLGWMVPGQAALGGDDGAVRTLRARITQLEAERDEAMRLAEELEAVLRALRESPEE